ncbi:MULTISPECIES: hypothetical protein [unclassified Streptomyces]|uniref:Secreted protein n=1 Tax=Streptomyces poriferorum TaxID=2798799 RepID=A0ABY9IJX4_9ACTN|nr:MULTISPECIES: hypothetical protein [unclassified Streptomyces]MDP5317327.1 hypothetical protein [Streptomyces sp. Alt4]WLQ55582.1 hypothetical protein P8A19_09070 [Streptomyces sp. Alt2]
MAIIGGLLTIAGAAHAAGTASPTVAEVSAEEVPPAIEDFNYPGAAKVLADKGLNLKRGDGHITLADCGSSPDLLKFIGRDRDDFCFKVTGDTGYLTLEVPAVTGVQTTSQSARIAMTVDDETKTYDIAENKWQGIGETTDPEQRDHVLVEISTAS